MISRSLRALAFATTTLLAANWAAAEAQEMNHQTMQHGQGMMGMMNMGSGDEGVASLAFRGASMKMHRDMAIEYTGDSDVDFVKGMIPHHQGAIDMAKIVLVFGKNPEIKKLAEDIIKAQETEVSLMKDWFAKNAK